MKKLNITPGEWFYGIAYEPERGKKPLNYTSGHYYDNPGIMTKDEDIVGCSEYDIFGPNCSGQREANISLIIDAGNTANKCGLMPSELLRQRDALLEVCKQIVWKLSHKHSKSGKGDDCEDATITRKDATVRMAIEAINRAEGRN